jgi:hypothetical protein
MLSNCGMQQLHKAADAKENSILEGLESLKAIPPEMFLCLLSPSLACLLCV